MNGPPLTLDLTAFTRDEARRAARVEAQVLTPVTSGPVGLWDDPPEAEVGPAFAEIVEAARRVTGADVAAFSVLDHERAWFRARVGVEVCSVPGSMAYCTYTVRRQEVVEIPDTQLDPEFAGNPLTLGYEGLPPVRSYAGVPLFSAAPERACVGTLCVFSLRPHALDPAARAGLVALAAQLEDRLQARERARRDPVTGWYHAPVMACLVERAARRARYAGGSLSLIGVVPKHPVTQTATRLALAARVGGVLIGPGELAGQADVEGAPGALLLLLPGSAPVHLESIVAELREALAYPGLVDDRGQPAVFGLGIAGLEWPGGQTGPAADQEASQATKVLEREALAKAFQELPS